jgi:membrane protease YdiL (CAAX protease family)
VEPFRLTLPWRLLLFGAVIVGIALGVGSAASGVGGNAAIVGLGFAQIVGLLFILNARAFRLPVVVWDGKIWKGLALGLVAALVIVEFQTGLVWLLTHFKTGFWEQPMVSILRTLDGVHLSSFVVMAGLLGPVLEEVYFRFWWLDWLRKRVCSADAVVWTALFFAFLHGNLWTVPGLFILGCVCGWARLRWGIVPAIACHSVFNLVTILALRGGWA